MPLRPRPCGPLATAIGLGIGARRGVLIRGGGALGRLARLKAVAFDKTGTLTAGDMHLVDNITADVEETASLRRAAGVPTENFVHRRKP